MRVGIFQTAFLGDVALCSLLIEALNREGHEIFLIIRKNASYIYSEDYRIKKCIEVNKEKGIKKIKSIFIISNKIKSLKLDVLLVPHKSATSAICSYLSKVSKRISYNDSCFKFVYTELRSFNKDKHECLRCLDIAPNWLISDNIYKEAEKIARPILIAGKNLNKFYSMNNNFLKEFVSFFIVSPGSVWATKKYPALNFAKAIHSILNSNNKLICILCGTSQDKNDIDEITNFFINEPLLKSRIINTSNYLPLNEFVNLVSLAKFVIANDSSPIHIASGLNIPVIGIFGPTSWKFGFYPTSEKSIILNYKDESGNTLPCHPCTPHGSHQCPQVHFRCMRDLDPNLLVKSVQQLVPHLF